ncbi:MAG: aldehyde dehydrogenase family protein [Acidimicrobiales bacterium]
MCGSIPEGVAADVDAAVAAARRAFDDGWGLTTLEERRKAIQRLAEALEARSGELAQVLSMEMGMPITFAGMIQAGLPVSNLKAHVDLIDEVVWEEECGNSLVVREPAGVVAAITPWNYPLHQIICKVAPAWRPAAPSCSSRPRWRRSRLRARRGGRRGRSAAGGVQPRDGRGSGRR